MKIRFWTIATFAGFSALANAASAQPVELTMAQLDNVVAGTYYCPPPPTTLRGNNGWGNGFDGNNPGSLHGRTAPSKSSNGSVAAAGRNNVNPAQSAAAAGGGR